MSANFSPQRLLNKSEARVFQQLETIVTSCNPRWLVMAQVSLGEILTSQNSEAYGCINSKRVDLLLVDEPTAQLDRATARVVNRVLSNVVSSETIVIVATHDEETRDACDAHLDLTSYLKGN